MPAKGQKYAAIDIDLRRWAEDEIAKTGEKKAHLAKRLGVERARVTELFQGKANTIYMLETIGQKALRGEYFAMAKYAKTEEGLKLLKDLQFKRKLTPYQRDVYERVCAVIQRSVMKDPDRLDKLLESELKKLVS